MMTVSKRTLIKIEHIERVEVLKPQRYDDMDFGESEITIFLKNGDRIELVLRSNSSSKLEFKEKKEAEWLTPKVYKVNL